MQQTDSLYYEQILIDSLAPKAKESVGRFFIEKGKVEIKENKREENIATSNWIHFSLLFWVIVLVFARQSFSIRLRQIVVATINTKQVKQLQREGNLLKQGYPVLLMLLYAFSISLFAFIYINQKLPNSFYFSQSEGFFLLFGIVISFHFLKFLIIWIFGILFETLDLTVRYLIDHYIFYISEGLILFPFLILFIYSGLIVFLYAAMAMLIILWLFRLQRAIVIGIGGINFSRSYLFLYLCTLEVLPILMLYKLSLQFI